MFLPLFLTVDQYFLISAVIAQVFIPIAEPVIPTGLQSKEAKAEIETHLVTAEAKITKSSI